MKIPLPHIFLSLLLLLSACTQKKTAPHPDSIISTSHYRWGFVGRNGKVIPCIFDQVNLFWNGYACVKYHGKWGIIDTIGRFVIPAEYERLEAFRHGIAKVWIREKGDSMNTAICLDTAGRRVVEPWWWKLRWYYACDPEHLHPMPDNATRARFDAFNKSADSLSRLPDRDMRFSTRRTPLPTDRYGYVDSTEAFVIQPMFVWARDFRDGLASVGFDTDYAHASYIDTVGNVVTPPNNYHPVPYCPKYARFQLGGKCGYRDEQGEIVIWPEFDGCDNFYEGLAVFRMNDADGKPKFGVIESTGEWIAPPIYDQTYWSQGGFVGVCLSR